MKDRPITDQERSIIRAIQGGNNKFSLITRAVDMDNCIKARMKTDRLMQSLRRRGLIEYTGQARSKGWKVIPAEKQG